MVAVGAGAARNIEGAAQEQRVIEIGRVLAISASLAQFAKSGVLPVAWIEASEASANPGYAQTQEGAATSVKCARGCVSTQTNERA